MPVMKPTPIISNTIGGNQIPLFIPNQQKNSQTLASSNPTLTTQNNFGANQIPIRFFKNNKQVFPQTLPIGRQFPVRVVQNNLQVNSNTSVKDVKRVIQTNRPPRTVSLKSSVTTQFNQNHIPPITKSVFSKQPKQPRIITIQKEPEQDNIKPIQVIVPYKIPFDYSCMDKNLQRTNMGRWVKIFEEKMNKPDKIMSKCILCKQKFPEMKMLSDHYEMHKKIADAKDDHDIQSISTICEKLLQKNEEDLPEEKRNSWMCVICDEVYKEKTELLNHYEVHKKISGQLECDDASKNQDDSIICPICEYRFTKLCAYKNHIKKHKPKEFTCSTCNQVCETDFDLSVHLTEHNTDTKTFVCNVCTQFSTTSTSDLATHININHLKKKSFCCEECGDNFTSEAWFNSHKIFHVKSGSLFCGGTCHRRFFQNRLKLINHMEKRHNINVGIKVRKFKCLKCDLTFPQESNLRRHNRDLHPNKKAYLCNICGMRCQYKYSLDLHLQTHGEGKYDCGTCGKKFKQKRTLTEHLRTHTGERPYKCKTCNKKFTQKTPLKVHIRTHTGERPYPCIRCSRGFITKGVRDNHQRNCKA